MRDDSSPSAQGQELGGGPEAQAQLGVALQPGRAGRRAKYAAKSQKTMKYIYSKRRFLKNYLYPLIEAIKQKSLPEVDPRPWKVGINQGMK